MGVHDTGYKRLFSHPRMVEDLLRGFVPGPWIRQLEFSTLERMSGSYVSDDLRAREDDVVWRVRWGNEWLYVYVLLEFQSTVDPFMAVRIQAYLALLYQDLIRRGEVRAGQRLPPVVPVVLYNGDAPWSAPVDVADTVHAMPEGLEAYGPRLRYVLIDEVRCRASEAAGVRNLAAALFRLEQSRTPEDVRAVVEALSEWLGGEEHRELRRAFAEWIGRVLLRVRLPGVKIPEAHELREVRAMLAERVKEWTEQWKREGLEEGRREGLQQGLQQGLQAGQIQAAREAVLEALEARFGDVPGDVVGRVEVEQNLARLKLLLRTAVCAESLEAFRRAMGNE